MPGTSDTPPRRPARAPPALTTLRPEVLVVDREQRRRRSSPPSARSRRPRRAEARVHPVVGQGRREEDRPLSTSAPSPSVRTVNGSASRMISGHASPFTRAISAEARERGLEAVDGHAREDRAQQHERRGVGEPRDEHADARPPPAAAVEHAGVRRAGGPGCWGRRERRRSSRLLGHGRRPRGVRGRETREGDPASPAEGDRAGCAPRAGGRGGAIIRCG